MIGSFRKLACADTGITAFRAVHRHRINLTLAHTIDRGQLSSDSPLDFPRRYLACAAWALEADRATPFREKKAHRFAMREQGYARRARRMCNVHQASVTPDEQRAAFDDCSRLEQRAPGNVRLDPQASEPLLHDFARRPEAVIGPEEHDVPRQGVVIRRIEHGEQRWPMTVRTVFVNSADR